MFELIRSIEVDRKNSLPVADLHARYRGTGTPVVFGDLTQHWPATKQWSPEYLAVQVGDVEVPVFSNVTRINGGQPSKPILHSRLEVYVNELLYNANDFRVSKVPLKSVSDLERDFFYPRLGFNFNMNLTSLGFAGAGTVEPMRQSSRVIHTVSCNFGERATVLLIPPEQTPFMYKVGSSRNSVRDINFDQPQFYKYPALRNISGYVAELNHGDALYIPAGFWVCTAYHGASITLSLDSMYGGFSQYAGVFRNFLLNCVVNVIPSKGKRLERLEKDIVLRTNARVAKAKIKAKVAKAKVAKAKIKTKKS